MRFNRLDLNQLVVLDILLDERSVSKAAERLNLSQPATSCALARLRDHFCDDLLTQVGKTMVLTSLAMEMIKPLREVILRMQAFTTNHAEFEPRTSQRKLIVEASDYVIEVFLTEAIRHCWTEAPRLKFEIRRLGTRSTDRLDQGDVDLLIRPKFLMTRQHPAETLFSDTLSCVAWTENPEVDKEISEAQYQKFGHVVAVQSDDGISLPNSPFKIKRRTEVTVPGFTLIPPFIVGSHRIAVLQTRLAHSFAQWNDLKVLQCPVETPLVEEVMQWHRFRGDDPLLVWMRSLLSRVALTI